VSATQTPPFPNRPRSLRHNPTLPNDERRPLPLSRPGGGMAVKALRRKGPCAASADILRASHSRRRNKRIRKMSADPTRPYRRGALTAMPTMDAVRGGGA